MTYVAVHIVSESADHYNFLVECSSPKQALDILKAKCLEDIGCWSDWFINSNAGEEFDRRLSDWILLEQME